MGTDQVTVRNLRVVKVMSDDNTLIVEGAVPGPKGAFVIVRKAKAPHLKREVKTAEAAPAKKK
jgi:large subunit ribosomal protein L3